MLLQLLALLPLPEAAQQQIIQLSSPEVRRALAASPFLTPSAANRLALGNDPVAAVRALFSADDTELLTEALKTKGPRAVAAARNPHAPRELLSKACASNDLAVALGALVNPASSMEARQSTATKNTLAALTRDMTPLGMSVARTYELVIANPWLSDKPELWTPMIKRAIGGMPWLTTDLIAELETGRAPVAKSYRLHPLRNGRDIGTYPTAELVLIGSSAADLAALDRLDFTAEHAKVILSAARLDAEPSVIARILTQTGPEAFAGSAPVADTRVRSTAWIAPAAVHIPQLRTADVLDYQAAVDALGSDADRWRTFLSLSISWEGRVSDLAHATTAL